MAKILHGENNTSKIKKEKINTNKYSHHMTDKNDTFLTMYLSTNQ